MKKEYERYVTVDYENSEKIWNIVSPAYFATVGIDISSHTETTTKYGEKIPVTVFVIGMDSPDDFLATQVEYMIRSIADVVKEVQKRRKGGK